MSIGSRYLFIFPNYFRFVLQFAVVMWYFIVYIKLMISDSLFIVHCSLFIDKRVAVKSVLLLYFTCCIYAAALFFGERGKGERGTERQMC